MTWTHSRRVALGVLVAGGVLYTGTTRLGGQPASVVAIRGGTILTITQGVIPNGTLLIRGGTIAAVGAAVPIPAEAEIVDATGRFVTPGLVDAHSHIAADAINEGGTTVSSMTGIEDVLDPTDVNIYRDLAGGLTTANVLHGSANPIGGKNAVIKLRWGVSKAEDLLFAGAPPGIKFALGENPKDLRQFGQQGPRRYPVTRPGVEYVIRDAFTRAKAYQRAWQEYARRKAAGEDPVPPRRDLQLEPLVEVLEGKRLVHAHSYRADEILMLIRLAEELGFRIATFQHVLEGYKVAKEIAAHGAGASTFADWWGYKIEALDAIPHNAALMTRKGVLVSINSDSAEHARRLNTEAAKAVRWGGLSEEEALALVTINPAKQLGVDRRVGSLEVGKDADVVIWTAHPLSTYAIVDRVYIDGVLYYDRQAALRRLSEVQREKARLVAAERPGRAPAAEEPKASTPHATDNGAHGGGPARPLASAPRAAEVAARRQAVESAALPIVAITNARLHPVSRPVIERGTLVIRGERIAALGADLVAPTGARIVDARGADVYPGWINARTTLGLAEPGPRGFADTEEMLDFNPQLRTVAAYNADSLAIPVARANGITTVAVVPSGGILGGQIAVMNLDGWTWEESVLNPNVGIALQLPPLGPPGPGAGGPPGRGERSYEELRQAREAKLDDLARLLDRARAYARAAPARERDWVLEALVPVVEGRLPLVARVDREADIRDVINFADRTKVRVVVSGGLEAPLVAPLLKERDIPVILGPILTLPTREDFWHAAPYQAAAELERAGVKFCFATGDTTNVRQLPYHAAQAVAWGLSRDGAIRALTLHAAEILGVADEVGSLEPGKLANLVIVQGDPLEIRTPVTQVFIKGREVDLMNRHEELYRRYLARP